MITIITILVVTVDVLSCAVVLATLIKYFKSRFE